MSSRKPISSISSASSRMASRRAESRSVRRRRWSITRPGVPMTKLAPRFSWWICRSIEAPPYTAATLTQGV